MPVLSGKTALVTGASSGIGKKTAELLLKEGAAVYAAARRVDRMRDLKTLGAKCLSLDITSEDSILHAFSAIAADGSPVDILINNAGYGSYGAIEDVGIEEARNQFEVNIFGLARLTQLVLPGMRSRQYGKIVNISSMGGKVYTPFGGWYHATKHALEGLSDCLRLETREFGIDVIIIEPGGITTDWGIIAAENLRQSSAGGAYAESARRSADLLARRYTSGRLTSPQHIARIIVRAVTARRPKPRYAAGFMAKPSIFLRRLLSDRIFDRIISSMS